MEDTIKNIPTVCLEIWIFQEINKIHSFESSLQISFFPLFSRSLKIWLFLSCACKNISVLNVYISLFGKSWKGLYKKRMTVFGKIIHLQSLRFERFLT